MHIRRHQTLWSVLLPFLLPGTAIAERSPADLILMGRRDRVGTIEHGMLADLVVLDRNPFRVPVREIHETRVKLTMIGGEVVYRVP